MTSRHPTPPRSRVFDLGDALSITPGALVSPRGIGGVYDLLGFLVGADLMTYELPHASRTTEPHLIDQHPWLTCVPPFDKDRWPATETGVAAYVHHVATTTPGAHARVLVHALPPGSWDPKPAWDAIADKALFVVVDPS